MKNVITNIAKSNYIDEIRFIDAEDLTDVFVGNAGLFTGRQPKDIMETAKTVIIASVYIGKYVSPDLDGYGRMSKLMISGFYTNVIKPLLPVKEYLENQGYKAIVSDGTTDERSIPIKGVAAKAGMGWIGKNTLLINEKYGSFRALGAVLTNADISDKYSIALNRCGKCSKCMDICPMNALESPRNLTRTYCLSHIFDGGEYTGSLALENIDTHKYFLECDICQNVCPWNRKHIAGPLETPYGRFYDGEKIRSILKTDNLLDMDEEKYNKELVPFMCDSVIPYHIFKRNLRIMLKDPA